MPSPVNPPSGCHFHTRCWLRERLGNPAECETLRPPLAEVAAGHQVACHFVDRVSETPEARPPEAVATATA